MITQPIIIYRLGKHNLYCEKNRDLFKRYLLKNKVDENKIEILQNEKYFDEIEDGILIFAVGNICGHGKKLVDYLENKGEIIDG